MIPRPGVLSEYPITRQLLRMMVLFHYSATIITLSSPSLTSTTTSLNTPTPTRLIIDNKIRLHDISGNYTLNKYFKQRRLTNLADAPGE